MRTRHMIWREDGKYENKAYCKYLRDQGIHHEFDTEKTAEQNGTVENFNYVASDGIKFLLSDRKINELKKGN